MVSLIIMASGSSNRMGTNKLLLPYKGKYLIEHLLDCVINCCFKEVILVAKDSTILNLGHKRNLKVIYNKNAEIGQSETIKLGIINSQDNLGYAFIVGDQPLINCNMINKLLNIFLENNDSIIVPTYKQKRGTPVIFSNRFQKELLNLQGDVGGKEVIKNNLRKVKYVEVSSPELLWDIDTIDDYLKLINLN